MRPSRLLLAGLVLTAALPAAAQAKLPSTSQPFLVPHEGIGGVYLHARIVKGKQAWGSGGDCSDYGCQYQDPRRYDLGSATFNFEDGPRGRITSIRVALGTRDGRQVWRSPLTRFRSDKLIGLGSTRRAVKAAYPGAKAPRGATDYLALRDREGDVTLFQFFQNRVNAITLMDDRPRG